MYKIQRNCGINPHQKNMENRMENRMEIYKIQDKFACSFCNKMYTWRKTLNTHLRDCHSIRQHAHTKICQPPQQLISKYPGNQEQRRYSPRNKFGLVCSICETKFNSYDLINEHVATCHYVDYLRELKADIKPRNMALVEEWRDTNNHLKCNKCDFVAQWPVALEQHAISHVTAIYPYKCFVCSHTYKRWWDLVTHFDHVHATFGKNPYKMKDRIAARRVMSADVDPATNFLALLINTALQNQHKQNEQQHMMEQQKEEQYMMEQQKEEQQKEQFLARKSTNDDWFL